MRMSPTMRSSRTPRRGGGGGCKRAAEEELVRIEIDAAEALAEFSKSCQPESVGFPELRWLTKRSRSSRGPLKVVSNSAVDFPLVKDEFSEESDKELPRASGMPLVAYNRFETSDDSLDPVESPSSPLPGYSSSGYVKNELGLVQHSAFKPSLDFDDEKPSRWGGKYRGKNDEGKRKRALGCNKPGGSRSTKALLTEEEKELRRLRRIEANRESARQTIRRKQKMCEEMTSKANDLSVENERIRKEIESVRQEMKRLSETSSSLRKQLEMANVRVPPLTSSDECSTGVINTDTPDQIESSKSPEEPMSLQKVQVNRQDDNIEELAAAPALEAQRTPCSSSSSSAPAAAGVSNNLNTNSSSSNSNNRPLQHVTQGAYNPHFTTFAKMMGGNVSGRGFYPPVPPSPNQQGVYSFFPGRSIAAENRRRRKELKQTRLYSRQVTLNS